MLSPFAEANLVALDCLTRVGQLLCEKVMTRGDIHSSTRMSGCQRDVIQLRECVGEIGTGLDDGKDVAHQRGKAGTTTFNSKLERSGYLRNWRREQRMNVNDAPEVTCFDDTSS